MTKMRWIDLERGGRIGQDQKTGNSMIVVPANYKGDCDTWHFLWDYSKEPKGTHTGALSEACDACEAAFLRERAAQGGKS